MEKNEDALPPLEQSRQPFREGVCTWSCNCFLIKAVPVPDGAWEECHSSVVIPTKFPCQLSVVREFAGTSPRALGTYIAKCAGPPVLTGRFAFGPAGAEDLPVQMSGRKNAQFLSTVNKKHAKTGRFAFGPANGSTCRSKCPAHFFAFRNVCLWLIILPCFRFIYLKNIILK